MKDVVKLVIIRLEYIRIHKDSIFPYIDEERRNKALKYKLEDDRLRSLGSSYLIKRYTSPRPIKYNNHGKPYKDDDCFNVSHSKDYVVIALSGPVRHVGVDIEFPREDTKGLEKYILSDDELKEFKKEDFIKFWCTKESLMKCLGRGLNESIKDVPSYPFDGEKIYNEKEYYTKILPYQDYVISVALQGKEDFDIELIELK